MSNFAEDKLHSAIRKQAFIALICIIFAKDKLHVSKWGSKRSYNF